jgi:serine phosphatase RsbU (regulator of sigma subunit)
VVARVIAVAVASRPYPGETENGDAWAIQQSPGRWRIALIDGLGHGPAAAAAAAAAKAVLAARPELGPAEAIRACHAALAGTRGAAISIVTIDVPAEQLTYAGVGNVEGILFQHGNGKHLTIYRGIVGSSIPTIRPFPLELGAEWMLLLHTDGVSARLTLPEDGMFMVNGLQALADSILLTWGRATDDATVVIASPAQIDEHRA